MKRMMITLMAVVLILSIVQCGKDARKSEDVLMARIDYLEKRIEADNKLVEQMIRRYDSVSLANDSLSRRSERVVVRYRTVREKGDTVEIVKACDDLALQLDSLVVQNSTLSRVCDSTVGSLVGQGETLKQYILAQKDIISEKDAQIRAVTDTLAKTKKLAKRRSRAIEW